MDLFDDGSAPYHDLLSVLLINSILSLKRNHDLKAMFSAYIINTLVSSVCNLSNSTNVIYTFNVIDPNFTLPVSIWYNKA